MSLHSGGMLKYYAGWADKLTGRTIPIGNDHFCYTLHEPVGVCGLIVPWNLPLIAVAAKVLPYHTICHTITMLTLMWSDIAWSSINNR
jgi:aldehyde dehydrogenase (NAD+)